MILDVLDTLDPVTLTPPESRVKSASSARSRVSEMRRAEGIRSQRRAKVQGLLDGNQPYPPQKMRDLGRAGDANINLRTGEGTVDAAKTPYYDLIFEVPRFTDIQIEYGDNPQRNSEWSETISDGFHRLLDEWDDFDFNTQLKQWQMCVHGIAIPMWENVRDWRFNTRKIGDVLVPDDTEAKLDKLEECAIPRSYMPVELYRLIENEDVAKASGWFPDSVRKAIINAAPHTFRQQWGNNWEQYQESIRTGDMQWGNKSNRILVVDYLAKEFSGKITHCILLDDGTPTTNSAGADTGDFLFKKTNRFESFSQVICPFFFDIGTGLWHSIKGLGPKIFDFCELENRLTGRLIDQAMAGLFVGAESADALQKMQLVPHGPVTVVPPGITFQNTRLAENLQAPLAVKRDLQNTLQSNTGQYRQRVSDENHEPTLGQAQLNAQQQAVLGKGAINRYYKTLDRMYREMLRRVLNPKLTKSDPGGEEAIEFIDWCLAKGVPREALKFENVCLVKAVRSIGYGSPQMREVASQKLLTMIPMMDEVSRRNAQRTILSPFVGQAHIDSFFPPIEQGDVPNDHVWAATMENNELRKPNGEVVVTPKQDHAIHFGIHFSDAMADVNALRNQQGHPIDVLIHLHNVGPHLKQHLDEIAGDETRKGQLQQMGQAWLMLSKITDQLQQQVEEAAKAEQDAAPQQPQLDPQTIAALAKVHGDLQIKADKMQGDMALKQKKQDVMLHLQDLKVAHGIRQKNRIAAQAAQVAQPTELQPAA